MANYASGNASDDQSWKSDYFINLSIPNVDGQLKGVGSKGIGLKLSRRQDKQLIDWLLADEANMAKFVSKLHVSLNAADGSSSSEFDLS